MQRLVDTRSGAAGAAVPTVRGPVVSPTAGRGGRSILRPPRSHSPSPGRVGAVAPAGDVELGASVRPKRKQKAKVLDDDDPGAADSLESLPPGDGHSSLLRTNAYWGGEKLKELTVPEDYRDHMELSWDTMGSQVMRGMAREMSRLNVAMAKGRSLEKAGIATLAAEKRAQRLTEDLGGAQAKIQALEQKAKERKKKAKKKLSSAVKSAESTCVERFKLSEAYGAAVARDATDMWFKSWETCCSFVQDAHPDYDTSTLDPVVGFRQYKGDECGAGTSAPPVAEVAAPEAAGDTISSSSTFSSDSDE